MKPDIVVIHDKGQLVLRVTQDGRVELGKGVTLDEAASQFWAAVSTKAVAEKEEAAIVQALADVWDRFAALPVEHPMDQAEFCSGIHVLQDKVLARAGRRALNAPDPVEAKAREIYDGWKGSPGWVPWVEGGNSNRQQQARRLAAGGV